MKQVLDFNVDILFRTTVEFLILKMQNAHTNITCFKGFPMSTLNSSSKTSHPFSSISVTQSYVEQPLTSYSFFTS